jgi:GNAT superfamily N-acetyltransferase
MSHLSLGRVVSGSLGFPWSCSGGSATPAARPAAAPGGAHRAGDEDRAVHLGGVRDVLRVVGPRRFIFEVVPWAVRRRYVFYALTLPAAAQPPALDAFRLDLATEADLALFVAARPERYTLPALTQRLGDGHLAFVGRVGESVAHLRWVFTRTVDVPYLRRRIVLDRGDVLLDEIYTMPAWRRKGVEGAVAVAMPRMLHEMGYRRILCAIASWNLAPQRVAAAHGYVRLGSGGCWALPGLRRYFWEGAVEDRPDGTLLLGRRREGARGGRGIIRASGRV